MKTIHIIHLAVTFLLVAVVTGSGFLLLTGVIEVRRPSVARNMDPAPPLQGEEGPRLVVVRGLRPKWEYRIHQGLNYIGRADEQPVDVDLQPQEPEDRVWSSRQHALITCEGEKMLIEDLGSANGTYVNRARVPPGKKRSLVVGDIIQVGEVQMKVQR